VDWLLVLDSVLPKIFKLGASRHSGTAFFRALFTNSAIYEVNPVEEIHHVHSQPVIEIFSLGQFDHLPQVDPRVEAGLGLLVQRVFHCARLELFLGPESFLFIEHFTKLC